jgi:septum site-determining protein MinC
MKQRTLRVFEVENYENLKKVVESKYALIKNHFFMLKEKNEEIEKFLREKNLSYFIQNGESFTSEKEKSQPIQPQIKIIEKETVVYQKPKIEIYDKIIRSGEEINPSSIALFFKRINAGAKITSEYPIEIYDENEGLVICEGEYIIVKKNIKGTIIFNGEHIGKVDKLTFFGENIKKVLE